jgi:hypothetical protein
MPSLDRMRPAYSATLPIAVIALFLVLSLMRPFGALGVSAALGQTAPVAPETPTSAAGNEPQEAPGSAVIPPLREDLLAQMLGRGATLPGSCTFAGGEVERTLVRASYRCPQGDVVFEMRHPSKAPSGATQTARFAITLKSGSPPDGLADALASLVRSHEAAFEWKFTGPSPRRTSPRTIVLLSGAGIAAIAALGWALVRRRRRPTTTP